MTASSFNQEIRLYCANNHKQRPALRNQALGHKNIKETLLYIQLEEALFQGEIDYGSKVAKTEKEICSLVEAGFEYVTEFQGAKYLEYTN